MTHTRSRSICRPGLWALLRAIGKRRGDIAHANDSAHRWKSLAGYSFLDAALAALTGGTIVVYLLFFVSEYATNRFGNCVLITSVPVLVGAVALSAAHHGAHGESPTDLVLGDSGMLATSSSPQWPSRN